MTPLRLPGALHRRPGGDAGVAMILVMGVAAIITVLSVTVATVSLNNLGNTRRDKQAGSAFATSEAGVAAVVERLRAGSLGLSSLTCMEPANPATPLPASCLGATMSWTSSVKPMEIPIDGTAGPCLVSQTCYKVWIGTLKAYSPTTGVKSGIYRVHSKGLFGNGPAASTVVVDLEVRPEEFPIGVFGEQVTGNGGTAVYNESLFTRECVSPRNDGSGNGTRFQGMDAFWDQPAAAHSTTMVSTSNGCSSSGNIHESTNCPTASALKNDQSVSGGPVASGDQCYRTHLRQNGSHYPDAAPTEGCTPRADGLCDSTSFTEADLKRYGYRPRGLSDDQYEALASRARATGTHNVAASTLSAKLTAALAAGIKQPVVYIDCDEAPSLCPGDTYDFSLSNIPSAFQQAPNPVGTFTRCATGPQPVVTLAVLKGNAEYSGGNSSWFDAALFVPDGRWRGNGGYNILGTIFTNDLSLGGNETFQLDSCFIRDLPAPLMQIQTLNFSQDDARDQN
jgi:Tfp pilus assembly protein PilX